MQTLNYKPVHPAYAVILILGMGIYNSQGETLSHLHRVGFPFQFPTAACPQGEGVAGIGIVTPDKNLFARFLLQPFQVSTYRTLNLGHHCRMADNQKRLFRLFPSEGTDI